MHVLRSELAQLPDMMAALARTVQAVDGIRASLAACEDALSALADARTQQSLTAIKVCVCVCVCVCLSICTCLCACLSVRARVPA
jgi:hypothetical protein